MTDLKVKLSLLWEQLKPSLIALCEFPPMCPYCLMDTCDTCDGEQCNE